ncbi:putative glycosidase CRH2 [Dispira simplex]|nr:putative glycosidase CRH2 [Dispira simplex]
MKFISVASIFLAAVGAYVAANDCSPKRWDFNNPSEMDSFQVVNCGDNAYIENGQMVWSITNACNATTLAYPTVLESGKISASIKSSDKDGAVTAFIMMGWKPNRVDELDFEWVGRNLDYAQSMYFVDGQRVGSDTQEGRHSVPSGDTSATFNTYAIEFTDTFVKWYVNDQVVRTLEKKSDATFPNFADHLQFGIWDGSHVAGWAGKMNWAAYDRAFAYMDWLEVTPYCNNTTTSTVEAITSTETTSLETTLPTGNPTDDSSSNTTTTTSDSATDSSSSSTPGSDSPTSTNSDNSPSETPTTTDGTAPTPGPGKCKPKYLK